MRWVLMVAEEFAKSLDEEAVEYKLRFHTSSLLVRGKQTRLRLAEAGSKRTFSLRYLVGDENALWLLMLYIRDMQASQQA